MFINSPLYVELKRIESTYPEEQVTLSIFTFVEASFSLDNYNMQVIIWITTFNAASFITRSCYLRLTLYGCRETPFGNLEPCNPKSIKPTDYKQSNIINQYMKDANNKKGLKRMSPNSVEEIRAQDKQS